MTTSITLFVVLVAANLILITVAVVRSMLHRNRQASERAVRRRVVRRPLAAGVSSPIAPPLGSELTSSRTDSLTGLLVAKEWNRIIADEDARVNRYRHPATVVIIELDGFDRSSPSSGREAGDRVLPALADALSRNARGADHLARIGPTRFGILLPETDEVAAINYIERVREACDLWLESGAIALQLAIGWASPGRDPSVVAVVHAEERMYAELRRTSGPRTTSSPTVPRRSRPRGVALARLSRVSRDRSAALGPASRPCARRRRRQRPATITCSMPTGYDRGSSYVAVERTVAGSNTTRSATAPSRMTPRSRRPSRAAGAEVILRIASSSDRSASSRTNWPRMRGKLP